MQRPNAKIRLGIYKKKNRQQKSMTTCCRYSFKAVTGVRRVNLRMCFVVFISMQVTGLILI